MHKLKPAQQGHTCSANMSQSKLEIVLDFNVSLSKPEAAHVKPTHKDTQWRVSSNIKGLCLAPSIDGLCETSGTC